MLPVSWVYGVVDRCQPKVTHGLGHLSFTLAYDEVDMNPRGWFEDMRGLFCGVRRGVELDRTRPVPALQGPRAVRFTS